MVADSDSSRAKATSSITPLVMGIVGEFASRGPESFNKC